MRIIIFGAGAVGCTFAGTLSQSGADVTLIARGHTAEVIASDGLEIITAERRFTARPRVVRPGEAVPPADCLIVALKAYGLARALPHITPLIGPNTTVLTAVNGIPWWYFHKTGGKLEGTHLSSVDPGGKIWHAIGPERALGVVLYLASEITQPGQVEQTGHVRLPLGEPSGEMSERLTRIHDLFRNAGMDAFMTNDIRKEIWQKVLGNVSTNPVSALTHATMDILLDQKETGGLIASMMEESMNAGRALGVKFDMDIPERLRIARKLGAFRTSMLQDVELGRKMEIDEILGAVSECATLAGTKTPLIDLIATMLRQKEQFFPRPAPPAPEAPQERRSATPETA